MGGAVQTEGEEMTGYMIATKNGTLFLPSLSRNRSGCVLVWTAGERKSENCKEWRAAIKAGVKIVRVEVNVI